MKVRTNQYAVVKRMPDGSSNTICFTDALAGAQEKMRELAHKLGGEYLVEDTLNHIMIAFIHVKGPDGTADFPGAAGPSGGKGRLSFPPVRKGLS